MRVKPLKDNEIGFFPFRLIRSIIARTRSCPNFPLSGFVKNSVISTDTAMRALLVIMFQPHAKDVVQLSSTEANEMVQRFAFRTCDKALHKGVRFGRLRRYADTSHLWFPERVEFVRVLSITIPNKKPRVDAFVFQPHKGVPRLLRYPIRINVLLDRITG